MSSSLLNNLQVNSLYTNNLVVSDNNINKQINDIIEILKPGLYKGITTYNNNNNSIKEDTLFIIHDINKKYNFIKYYILKNEKIEISNFTINDKNIIIKSTISLKNNISYSRESKIISTNDNSIKTLYKGYKHYTKTFHENCNCDINLIDNGFEVNIYDENNNLINKSTYTKIN